MNKFVHYFVSSYCLYSSSPLLLIYCQLLFLSFFHFSHFLYFLLIIFHPLLVIFNSVYSWIVNFGWHSFWIFHKGIFFSFFSFFNSLFSYILYRGEQNFANENANLTDENSQRVYFWRFWLWKMDCIKLHAQPILAQENSTPDRTDCTTSLCV